MISLIFFYFVLKNTVFRPVFSLFFIVFYFPCKPLPVWFVAILYVLYSRIFLRFSPFFSPLFSGGAVFIFGDFLGKILMFFKQETLVIFGSKLAFFSFIFWWFFGVVFECIFLV